MRLGGRGLSGVTNLDRRLDGGQGMLGKALKQPDAGNGGAARSEIQGPVPGLNVE